MPRTQTTRRLGRKPGRPKAAKQPEQDGRRLREALEFFGWREAEIVARTGISQFTLNQIMNGNRSLGREDLRALGKIGISADYLLGHDKKLIAIGETRPVGALESELAARVIREVLGPVEDEHTRDYWSGLIRQVDLLGALVKLVDEEIVANVEWTHAQVKLRVAIESLPAVARSDVALAELRRHLSTEPPSGRVFRLKRRTEPKAKDKPTKRRKS